MKNVLFVSFDLIRPGEIGKSLAVGSILSYLKSHDGIQQRMKFHHVSINSLTLNGKSGTLSIEPFLYEFDLSTFEFVAISAYIWNEYLVNDFIKALRIRGFIGKVILGGYQITYSNQKELPVHYPDIQIFISGFAEESLKELFLMETIFKFPYFLNLPVDFSIMPSPYLTEEIEIPLGASMIRLETKRGCPYRCSFCAHRDLSSNKVFKHPLEKVFHELSLIKEREVKKVNILDPIFNSGKEYLDVMNEINRINSNSTFALQSRFENIKGSSGDQFLGYCEKGNYHLEFGLQTADLIESQFINRKNNNVLIEQALNSLNEREISFEVSLIYGLPGQTLDSFKRSVDFVLSKGCKSVKAFPLMLLRGTELYFQKEEWEIKEEILGDFNIPLVTSSKTFSRSDWQQMNELAIGLSVNERF